MEEHLLQSLTRPEAYEDRPLLVTLKQTHVSYLFITDRYVYKVKKPVDFGFLNFTTIDRRRFYCEEEVRLNRRLSPDVYLGVTEVRHTHEGASFTGDGRVIDYAVKMRRLPDERMLDRLVDEGVVDREMILAIATKVARFHLLAERSPEIDSFGSVDSIRQTWEENFRLTEQFVGQTVAPPEFSLLRQWVDRFLAEQGDLFLNRINGGFIRDCDGDLHLANICVGDDIWIFDCIEFNNRFRYLDTASDIAFLLMDLDSHCRPDLAALFLDEYRRLTGDDGCLPLVDFYKVYRAFVRAKVSGLLMLDAGITDHERDEARQRSISYFRLARGYLVRRALPKTLIMIGGMIGSGKSTVARNLGRELGLEVISSDRIRKEIFRPDSASGQGMYSQEADSTTYGEMFRRAREILDRGGSVIVDATFRRMSDRARFRDGASAAGASVCLAMTVCPEETTLQRLAQRTETPDRYSDAGTALFTSMQRTFQWPDPLTEPYVPLPTSGSVWVSVDTLLPILGITV